MKWDVSWAQQASILPAACLPLHWPAHACCLCLPSASCIFCAFLMPFSASSSLCTFALSCPASERGSVPVDLSVEETHHERSMPSLSSEECSLCSEKVQKWRGNGDSERPSYLFTVCRGNSLLNYLFRDYHSDGCMEIYGSTSQLPSEASAEEERCDREIFCQPRKLSIRENMKIQKKYASQKHRREEKCLSMWLKVALFWKPTEMINILTHAESCLSEKPFCLTTKKWREDMDNVYSYADLSAERILQEEACLVLCWLAKFPLLSSLLLLFWSASLLTLTLSDLFSWCSW